MKVTIHDVARHAGVSAMTVSRVINDSPRVNIDTRKRVQASISKLGYVPNRLARGLIQRKTGARGLRSILEGILLETMFELPTLSGVQEVVITADVVEGKARPLYTYSDKAEQKSAS